MGLAIVFLVSVLSGWAIADTTAMAVIQGLVPPVRMVNLNTVGAVLNLSGSGQKVKVLEMSAGDNDINGFKLVVSSLNNGELRASNYQASQQSSFINYRLDLTPGAFESVGTTTKLTEIDLSQGPYEILYNSNVNDVTQSAVWDILASWDAKNLFTATYTDTLQVTIQNN